MMGSEARARKLNPQTLTDAAWVLGLLLLGGRYFAPLEQVAAIELWDETAYMLRGLRWPLTAISAAYAPLYSLFYRLLAWVEPEPLRLYYLAYRAGAVLLALAVYWALRRGRVQPWFGGWAAWAVLTARGNAVVWPRVPVFALAWMLFGLGAVWGARGRATAWRWASATVVLWTAAYIRPEMAAAALLAGLVAAWLAWRARRRGQALLGPGRAAWAGLLAAALAPLLLWGLPVQGGRSWDAFAQHFTVRRAEMGDPIENPWRSEGIRPTIARYFGPDVHSIPAAIRANPRAVITHVLANARSMHAQARLDKLLDFPRWRAWLTPRRVVEGFSLLGLALWLWRARTARARAVALWLLREPLPWLALAASPPLGSMLFIFPHVHYAWMLAVLGWVAWALVVAPRTDDVAETSRIPWAWVHAALSVMLLTGMLNHARSNGVDVWLRPTHKQVVPGLAAFVRGLNLTPPVAVLGAEGGLDVYLGPHVKAVDEDLARDSSASLTAFIEDRGVQLLIFPGDDPLKARFCRGREHECAALVARPHEFGFRARRLSLAQGGYLFLVAEDAAPARRGP